MSLPKRYNRFLSNAFLLVGYVFLFSSQTNYRFYSAANFFDYHHASHIVPNRGSSEISGYLPGPNKSHLGVDKRYSAKHFVKLSFTSFPAIASYEVVSRIYYVPLKVYESFSLLPTNALRGPPCA
jgi:hypothetical protein